ISRDGTTLAWTTNTHSLVFWHLASLLDDVPAFDVVYEEHNMWYPAFNADGTLLAYWSFGAGVRFLSPATLTEIAFLEGARGPLTFSADGTLLATIYKDDQQREIQLWGVRGD
ncbi:MAG: hypothetical protein K8S97_13335, partial [Anaerolineae bacterium]|nr:hypothetical protein [Anaerolineae bacterium]